MRKQSQQLKHKLKRSVCSGLVLFLLAMIGAGCATQKPPPPEQGPHIKLQSGESSAEVSWPQ